MEERQPLTGHGAACAGAGLPPALRRALRVHAYPRWKRHCLRVPWYQLGNGLFVAAMISYVAAALKWLAIEGDESSLSAPAAWGVYNRLTLIGAVLFATEPLADFAGRWAATVFAILEQAHWECGSSPGTGGLDQRDGTAAVATEPTSSSPACLSAWV